MNVKWKLWRVNTAIIPTTVMMTPTARTQKGHFTARVTMDTLEMALIASVMDKILLTRLLG